MCRYGQLSGMVEPLAGLFGAAAVVVSLACVYVCVHVMPVCVRACVRVCSYVIQIKVFSCAILSGYTQVYTYVIGS